MQVYCSSSMGHNKHMKLGLPTNHHNLCAKTQPQLRPGQSACSGYSQYVINVDIFAVDAHIKKTMSIMMGRWEVFSRPREQIPAPNDDVPVNRDFFLGICMMRNHSRIHFAIFKRCTILFSAWQFGLLCKVISRTHLFRCWKKLNTSDDYFDIWWTS